MPVIDKKQKSNIIPEYSLTGDLLSYLRCNKQYRYQKKGNWKSTNPVQVWMGEFLHKMMARGYKLYKNNPGRRMNSYDWEDDLRPLEIEIYNQLNSVGIRPPGYQFCRYDQSINDARSCNDAKHPHKTLASERAEQALKIIGEIIYPHISEVERKLKGIKNMPNYVSGEDRSSKYGLTGVVDVISSINLFDQSTSLLVDRVSTIISNSNMDDEFEIIIDYKGSRRPPTNDTSNLTWLHHEWQITEYAWLRKLQNQGIPVKIGIVIYINELVPSKREMWELKNEIKQGKTDILPLFNHDIQAIKSYQKSNVVPNLTNQFRLNRAFKIIDISQKTIQNALQQFDKIVREVETNINIETAGGIPLLIWKGFPEEKKCTICNLKTFCLDLANNSNIASNVGTDPQIPPQI